MVAAEALLVSAAAVARVVVAVVVPAYVVVPAQLCRAHSVLLRERQ